jgi:hypothetical protein
MALAAAHLEILARRWPQMWELAGPALPAIMADEFGFAAIVARFGRETDIRTRLLSRLIHGEGTQVLARRLILKWLQSRTSPTLENEINQLVAKLMSQGDPGQAYALFRATRNGEAKADDGFVHNAEFSREPSGTAFDWRVKSQAGLSAERVKRGGSAGEPWMVEIRFLDSPIRLHNLMQTLALAPGNYRLTVRYETRGLRMPQPVSVALSCMGNSRPLAEAVLEGGDRDVSIAAAGFALPASGCAFQEIALRNGNATETWRNRYSGTLMLHSISVERLANP